MPDARERAKRAWDDWTEDDRSHELAAVRELGNVSMATTVRNEALKLLGSFARFAQKKDPKTAEALGSLAVEWAKAKGIPEAELFEAIMQADE